jgi:integrase
MRITTPREDEPIRLACPGKCPTRGRESARHEGAHRYRAVISTGTHADGKRRQSTRTFDTLSEAREWVSETRLAVKRGTFAAPARVTFSDVADAWLTSHRDVREVTLSNYRNVLKPVRQRIGHRKVQDLTRSDVDALVTWLTTEGGMRGKGLSRVSVVYTLGRVSQVLAYAVAEGLVLANVADGVRAPRKRHDEAESEVAVWTPEQMLTFRRHADAHEWAALWRLSLSGLRRSEVMGMRWRDVDTEAGTVTVTQARVLLDGKTTVTDAPKSAASWRTVPVESMHAGSTALLRAHRRTQAAQRLQAGAGRAESDLLALDAVGQPIRPEAYSDEFARLCRQAGVPTIRMHAVRHTLALTMHRAGTAPADAASLLGHSLAVHLSTYVPRSAKGAESAAVALGQVLATAR